MSEFTKGPWRLSRFAVTLIEDEAGRGICTTGGYQQNFDTEKVWLENRANASLIAAAPEMYEALRKIALMRTWNECAQSVPQERPTKADIANQRDDCIAAARAVLAKAEPTP